tara:strand:- start:408 stop:728 length:321 start_codon:yes stop_codon:yes gene_type:complete
MKKWTKEIEEELTLLVKDWLKNKGRTQVDLRESLQASSSRMPALLEVLRKEYSLGGIPKIAERLCSIENDWMKQETPRPEDQQSIKSDPFNQLDLLLEELQGNLKN